MNNGFAVIPDIVRYDKDLPPAAKLLYGEVFALSQKEGYCWANNSYFADLYGVSQRSIQAWIKKLRDKNYITVEVLNNSERKMKTTCQVKKKMVVVQDMEGVKNSSHGMKKSSWGYEENFVGGMKKSSGGYEEIFTPPKPEIPWESKAEGAKKTPNNKYNNKKNNKYNNTPYIPQRGNGDESLVKQFDEWWDSYPKKVGKKPTWNKYKKIHPSESLHMEMMEALSKQKEMDSWKRGYIPNPLTWINQERWNDEVEASKHESKNPFDEYLESECL